MRKTLFAKAAMAGSALMIAAAPLVSLVVVPAAFARRSGERVGAPELEEVAADARAQREACSRRDHGAP